MNPLPPPAGELALILIEIICFLSGVVLGAIWELLRAGKQRNQEGDAR